VAEDAMSGPRVVIIGGGLAGLATALELSERWADIIVLESGSECGGLARSFQRDGRFYPLAYHHILSRDHTLLQCLKRLGILPRVRWRRIRMLYEAQSGLYNLARPWDLLRFPLPFGSKVRFAKMMLRSFAKTDWSDWRDRSGDAFIDEWADPLVRTALFDPLVRLKFNLECSDVSAAWLGTRLHFREGSAALGYIPDSNWTKLLCDGVERLATDRGVQTRVNAAVRSLKTSGNRATGVELNNGERIDADFIVSAVPAAEYVRLAPDDGTPHLGTIKYTALLSLVCGTAQRMPYEFYWLNLATGRHSAGGLFNLSALNPTLGCSGEVCLDFVTHLPGVEDERFRRPTSEIVGDYLDDFRRVFGVTLTPLWTHLSRVPVYSPVFLKDYRPCPVRSTSLCNMYFAGSHCASESIASTGTALACGITTAVALLHDADQGGWVTVRERPHSEPTSLE